jgi:hypothetical protein
MHSQMLPAVLLSVLPDYTAIYKPYPTTSHSRFGTQEFGAVRSTPQHDGQLLKPVPPLAVGPFMVPYTPHVITPQGRAAWRVADRAAAISPLPPSNIKAQASATRSDPPCVASACLHVGPH